MVLKLPKSFESLIKKVIIIAQTAYALSGDKEKAISSGCNDYIKKTSQEK